MNTTENTMDDIKVIKVIPQTVEAFDNNDVSLGMLNEYEAYDLRVQIMKHKAIGYYFMFNGIKCEINERGRFIKCPDGLFDFISNKIDILIGI